MKYPIMTQLSKVCRELAYDMIKDKSLMEHTLRVVNSVYRFSEKLGEQKNYEKARLVALLHDVIEDTSATYEDLKNRGIPEEIIEAVKIITRKDKQDYKDYIQLVSTNPIARLVKLADLKDNIDITRLDKFGDYEMKRLRKYWLSYKFLIGEITQEEYQLAKY